MDIGLKRLKKLLLKKGVHLSLKGVKLDTISPQIIIKNHLAQLQNAQKPAVIVQIGANDGKSNDPIFDLLQDEKSNIEALFVEPQPDQFAALQNNYSHQKSYKFIKAAIVADPTKKHIVMHRIHPAKYDEYRKIYKKKANPSGITSLNKNHVMDFLIKVAPRDYFKENDIANWVEDFKVQALTYGELLRQNSVPHVDILQVDVEGYDYHIVKMALEMNAPELNTEPLNTGPLKTGLLPKIINFEHKHLQAEEKKDIQDRLIENNFSLLETKADICAFRQIILE